MHDVGPRRAAELVAGLAEQEDLRAVVGKPAAPGVATSSITPSTPMTGVGRIGVVPVWL